MQAKLDHVLRLSRELVFDHGMKQRDIYKAITKHLLESSTNKIHILYNDCYGGFSFSNQFCKYAGVVERGDYNRKCHDDIVRFGKMLCDKYPKVSTMLSIYHKHDMNHHTTECLTYNTLKKQKAMMEKNVEQLLRLPSDMYIHTTDVIQGLVFSCMYHIIDITEDKNGKYTVQQLIDELQRKIDETAVKMEDMLPNLNLYIYNVLGHESMKSKNTKKGEYTFLTAIEKYGESDSAIWDHQSHVNSTAMKCLLLMDDSLFIAAPLDEHVNECFGLMGASGKHSCLKFAEVPAELSWTISEYDGLESVQVV